MGRIVWTPGAVADLREIVRYIARDSPGYAGTFALHLREKVGRLAHFPRSGRVVPEDPMGERREVIAGAYRVIYRIRSDEDVLVLAVIHGARELRLPP